jgi:hypothetical protein
LVEFLGSFRYKIIFTNRDNFTSTFPNWIPFILFSCPITLARNSSTILNKSGKSRQTYYILDCQKMVAFFYSFSMILFMNCCKYFLLNITSVCLMGNLS